MAYNKINLITGKLIKDGETLFDTQGTGRAEVELSFGEDYENHKDKIQVMAEEEERRRAEEYAAYQQREINNAVNKERAGIPSDYGHTYSAMMAEDPIGVDYSPVFDGGNLESISGVNATPDQFEKELAMQELMEYSNQQKERYAASQKEARERDNAPSAWEEFESGANDIVLDGVGATGNALINTYDWASGLLDDSTTFLNNLNRSKTKPKLYGRKGTK
jgi:hypothetical protein